MVLIVLGQLVMSQTAIRLSGRVLDEKGEPMPGVIVYINGGDRHVSSLKDGTFCFPDVPEGKTELTAEFIGYENFTDTLFLENDLENYVIQMEPATYRLNEVTIMENIHEREKREESLNVETVDDAFMLENIGADMMKTLSRLPGISSIDIGSGQSKPIIRGLAFNRVVVAESGIKHEAQQWGADHGLEIDQFNVASVKVVKGPASLMFGSDAIAGVIRIRPYEVPDESGTLGNLTLFARSNNNLLGASANASLRKGQIFLVARITSILHGDYRVPTDTVTYNTYDFVLKDQYLRNTAGREMNAFVAGGFTGKQVISKISIGNYYRQSGFYADAHGLEIRNSNIDFDASNRDIDLPYQEVNHLKVISNTTVIFGAHKLDVDLAFQNNLRKENAEAVEHGYRPVPPGTLERKFNKNVFSGKMQMNHLFSEKHQMSSGLDIEYQNNRIGGWGFIIPAFRRMAAGFFVYDKHWLSERLILNTGVRLDYGQLKTETYRDWYVSPVFDDEGNMIGEGYALRSPGIEKTFLQPTWSIGLNYTGEQLLAKLNFGKSFRMPDARELGVDGVNYHLYRQEKGDSTLTAETAYQTDLSLEYKAGLTRVNVSGFFSWFPGYIYLNPTSDFSQETGLQIFNYVQNEVIRWGGEVEINQQLNERISVDLSGEYVYSRQMTGNKQGFGLPFSPPLSGCLGFNWEPGVKSGQIVNPYLRIETKAAASQNRVVPPEDPTYGYVVFNLRAGTQFLWGEREIIFNLQLNNMLNTKYFNHTSYYRIINIPEPGRNLQINIKIPF